MNLYSAIHAAPLWRVESMPPEGTPLALICHSQELEQVIDWGATHFSQLHCVIPEDPGTHWQKGVTLQRGGTASVIPVLDMASLPSVPHLELCYYSRRREYAPLHSVATRLRTLGLQSMYICRPPLGIVEGKRHVPTFLEEHASRLDAIYASLADNESRQIFAARIKALLTGNMGYLSLSDYACYQHLRVPCSPGFIVVDGGCAWGGLEVFSNLVGPEGHVWGFEPDSTGFASILPAGNTTVTHCGLWHENMVGEFNCSGSSTSLLREGQTGPVQRVPLVRLDDFARERGISHVDFLKLDVEGAELKALRGAVELLRVCRPNLAICIYHNNSQDLVDVPEYIRELDLGYNLYVGQHAVNAYDTVLYATSPFKDRCTFVQTSVSAAIFANVPLSIPDAHKYHQAVLDSQGNVLFPGSWNPQSIAGILTSGNPAFWQGKSVLDIGANTAGLSLELARMGATVCATEPDPRVSGLTKDMILHCARAEGLALRLENKPLLACHELGNFDVICCLGLLYHFRYPQYILDYLSTLQAETLFVSSQTYASPDLIACNRKNLPQGWHYDDSFSLAGWHPSHTLLIAMLRTAGFTQVTSLTEQEYNFPEKPQGATNSAYYRATYGEVKNPEKEKGRFV